MKARAFWLSWDSLWVLELFPLLVCFGTESFCWFSFRVVVRVGVFGVLVWVDLFGESVSFDLCILGKGCGSSLVVGGSVAVLSVGVFCSSCGDFLFAFFSVVWCPFGFLFFVNCSVSAVGL